MTKITYPSSSAYAATPQSDNFIGRYVHRSIEADGDDRAWTVEAKYEHRPDRLASDLYGRSSLYWVFVSRNLNLMRDPFWDLKEGIEIVLPSRAYLERVLGL